MDEIGSMKGTIQESEELKFIREQIKLLDSRMKGYAESQNYEQADIIKDEITKLRKQYNSEKKKFIKEKNENPIEITKNDILEIVSIKTNIPVNNLTSDDKKKLSNMNERIKESVIGQDEAIDTICKALKRNRIGLHNSGCMYCAMAIGKSGVGKCVSGNTNIKIRNKKTGEIQILTINEFKNLVSSSSFSYN